MDSRIYFHQYRRPRASNPTYMSSNVQNSMAFFNGGSYLAESRTRREYANSYSIDQNYSKSNNNPLTPSYQPNVPQHEERYQQRQRNVQPNEGASRQENSKLSNYGQRSLTMDQRGVYNKQSSKFDIISLKPLEHNASIRQYPWLTLENRDDVYYKRMNEIYNGEPRSRAKTYEKQNDVVAGKQTYDYEPKIANTDRYNERNFNPKMLNHMDELRNNLA